MSDSVSKRTLELSVDFDYGLTGLDNIALSDLVYGGRLDSLKKSIMSANLEETNYVGGELTAKGTFLSKSDSLFGSDKFSWYAQLGYSQQIRVNFSKDAYDLMFFGNQAFEGGSAKLNVEMERWHYQKLEMGIYEKELGFYAGLGLFKGSDWQSISTESSKFYTDAGGTSLDLSLHANAQFSDSSKTGLRATNGLGLGLQLGYIFKNSDKQSVLQVSVEDLGVMYWNNKSRSLSKDTLYNFQGFDLDDLLNGNLNFSNVDDTLNLSSNEEASLKALPFMISVRKLPAFEDNHNLAVTYGLNYRYKFHTRPEMYAGLVYRPSETALISAAAAYGGYYGMHMKFDVNMFLSEEVSLAISSKAVVNSILNAGRGKSINLNLLIRL